MQVTLIGLGGGSPETMTLAAQKTLAEADVILGAPRLLAALPDGPARKIEGVKPMDLLSHLTSENWKTPCVVFSGDTGFYSGAKKLLPLLRENGIEAVVLPGLSSLQVFAAQLGRSWQDWRLCSAHGVAADPAAEVCHGQPVFFLTGGKVTPADLCRRLTQAGLGSLPAAVGEDLSYPTQRICQGTAADLAEQTFSPLSVLLVDPAPRPAPRASGLPDEEFIRGKVPMTKQEVRAAILAKLGVGPQDLCWDIGAGTGSVSVELALHSRAVWAVEEREEACGLIRQNRETFGAWNLHLVQGTAPAACEDLPAPDAVFIGGSGGELGAILSLIAQRGPKAPICISAITLETLHRAVTGLEALGYDTEIVQLAVNRARHVKDFHLLLAQNPVFLITGRRP